MKGQTLQRLIGSFRRTLDAHQLDDAGLLERYRSQHDLDALEALVRKHGGMVLNAAHRVLHREADIEDAFQATFLVLMNQSHRVRNVASLGSWLYGVAHRIALQIHAQQRRRERLDQSSSQRPTTNDVSLHEACLILHEELNQLADRYRLVLMLCYLEGKSRDEAADALGWSVNKVRGMLERGREQLRKRLEKRGVSLSVGLLGLVGSSLTAGVPSSCIMQRVLGSTVSLDVAELAQGVFPMMSHWPLKIGITVLLMAGVFAMSWQLRGIHAGPVPSETPIAHKQDAPKESPNDKPKDDINDEAVNFRGTVVDAEGNPVAQAKVYLMYYTAHRDNIPVRTTTNAQGEYQFSVRKSSFHRDYDKEPWRGATTFVYADGHGVAWSDGNEGRVRLKKQGELTGRFINLEGQPIEGVRVQVVGLKQSPRGDLSDWLKELNQTNAGMLAEQNHLQGFAGSWMGADLGEIIPVAVSGRDGRFRIPNVGPERVFDLIVSGPNVETKTLKAMTREQKMVLADEYERADKMMPSRKIHYVGNNFDLVLNHGRTVTGVAKDAATGKPIAGAKIYEYQLANDPQNYAPVARRPKVTNANGQFTIQGLPIKGNNVLVAVGPQGQRYLMQRKTVVQPEGFGPATLDFELVEGITVNVKAVDKATKKPMQGNVSYYTLASNESIRTIKGFAHPSTEFFTINADNSVTMNVPPGPAMIAFRSQGSNSYVMGVGEEAFAAERSRDGYHIDTRPYYVMPSNYNNLVRIDPKADQQTMNVTIELDVGQSATGKIVAPEGIKLTGDILVQNCKPSIGLGGEVTAIKATEFTVEGLVGSQTRLVVVRVPDQKLTGFTVVSLKESKPAEVKLVPWATLKGRVVDPDGKPYAKARIAFMQNFSDRVDESGHLPDHHTTDADGNFTMSGLTPTLKYTIGVMINNRVPVYILESGTLKAGETRNLGEVRAKENP